jgi:organic hydroperoxide reductase OsmC/OhrA
MGGASSGRSGRDVGCGSLKLPHAEFSHVARNEGFAVIGYHDHAEDVMENIGAGKEAVTKVVLHPKIEWIGEGPDQLKLDRMHHQAHEAGFIANSVKTQVTVA